MSNIPGIILSQNDQILYCRDFEYLGKGAVRDVIGDSDVKFDILLTTTANKSAPGINQTLLRMNALKIVRDAMSPVDEKQTRIVKAVKEANEILRIKDGLPARITKNQKQLRTLITHYLPFLILQAPFLLAPRFANTALATTSISALFITLYFAKLHNTSRLIDREINNLKERAEANATEIKRLLETTTRTAPDSLKTKEAAMNYIAEKQDLQLMIGEQLRSKIISHAQALKIAEVFYMRELICSHTTGIKKEFCLELKPKDYLQHYETVKKAYDSWLMTMPSAQRETKESRIIQSINTTFAKLPEWMQVLCHEYGIIIFLIDEHKKYGGLSHDTTQNAPLKISVTTDQITSNDLYAILIEEIIHQLDDKFGISRKYFHTFCDVSTQIKRGQRPEALKLIQTLESSGGSLFTAPTLMSECSELLADIITCYMHLMKDKKKTSEEAIKILSEDTCFGKDATQAMLDTTKLWTGEAKKAFFSVIPKKNPARLTFGQKWETAPYTHIPNSDLISDAMSQSVNSLAA